MSINSSSVSAQGLCFESKKEGEWGREEGKEEGGGRGAGERE